MRFRWIPGVAAVLTLVLVRAEPYPFETRHWGEIRPLLLREGLARSLAKPVRPLLIDLYWLRALNGMGEAETAERNQNLAQYGFFLTELDPRFFHAYYYLALVTPYSLGGDRYLNGELALALVRKGLAQFPTDIRLRTLHAFLLTYIEHDTRAAVMEFVEISKQPNAPAAAISAATALFVDEGRFDEAIEMISQAMGEESRGGLQLLSDRKKQLEIEKLLRTLDAAIERTRQKTGRMPQTLEAVVEAGEWPAELTHDPHGGELAVKDGRGYSSWLVGRMEGITRW
ncbi:MAG: hypothetical protein JNJ54_18840 [Myxococcaceae bacterium]|nr:hypothetical protein [Myxococcaceae bacterium]